MRKEQQRHVKLWIIFGACSLLKNRSIPSHNQPAPTVPCSHQGLPAGALSSQPHTWGPRLRQRIKPISPSPPTLGKLCDRRMKEVCALPATHVLSKFTARQSLLFVLAPPSLPAIHALRDFISSKWRLEREESKQEKEEEKKKI